MTPGVTTASLLLAVLAGADDLPPVEVMESAKAVAGSREEYVARRGIREFEAVRPAILQGEKPPLEALGNPEKGPPASLVRDLFLELHARRASLSPASRSSLGARLYGSRRLEGKEILFELLGEPDPEIRRGAIEEIRWGAAENDWPLAFTPGDLARLRAALEDPDEAVRRFARVLCSTSGAPGAEARIIEWLRVGAGHPDDREAESLFHHCNLGYHASEVWRTFLLEVLGEGSKPEDAHLVLPAARANLSHPDPRVAELAERRCEDDFLARAASMTDWFQTPSLTRFAGKRSAPLIEKALAAPAATHQSSEGFRMQALEAYGRADPEKAAPYLLDVLDRAKDRADAHGAIQGLVHAADPGSAPIWTARILKRLETKPPILSFDSVAGLFLRRGGDTGRGIVIDRFHELDGRTRFRLLGAIRGTSPRDVFRDFHAAGLIPALPAPELVTRVASWSGVDPGSVDVVESVLIATGDLIHFDAEADEIPVRHDLLAEMLADRTRGAFRIHDVWQTWDRRSEKEREGDYTVRFSIGDTLFRFRARFFSDWYDIGAVTGAMNKALERAGRPERFRDIFASGQTVSYIFADDENLAAVCRKYLIPCDAGGDAARKAGVEYEKRVLEALEAK